MQFVHQIGTMNADKIFSVQMFGHARQRGGYQNG